jgi:predicted molibdopterin-dependent oxidoreductase YjgC
VTVKKFSNKNYFVDASGVPGEYLCRYGRFGCEIFVKKQRIKTAELRSNFEGRSVEISEARRHAVSGLKDAVDKFGPEKVGVFVSPDLTNEELYLAGRIAREGLGTNNVASLSILTSKQESGILDEAFGFTGSTNDRSCIQDADLIICNNTSIESDHLILSVDVVEAVRKVADLIVINSTLSNTDRILSTLTLDPMRGRASILWKGIIKLLYENGIKGSTAIGSIEDLDDFEPDSDFDMEKISELTGVDPEVMKKMADVIASAEKIVIIHSPDRPQDRARGDMEMLANLIVLLRRSGIEADLLLPQKYANAAGLEIMGTDPVFAPGRLAVGTSVKGASSRAELYRKLKAEEIKAALVIGEDPMGWSRTEAWFKNVEFLVVMDWTPTETTRMANVVFPGSTYLETKGTRCNFEGKLIEFSRAVEPPASVSGMEILADLAKELGVELTDDIRLEIWEVVEKNLDKALVPYCWNTGQSRTSLPKEKFMKARIATEPGSIPPPLTQYEGYKREIISVGTKHYKVK